MIQALVKQIFGSRNERLLKGMDKNVAKINALEPDFAKLSDEALQAKTQEFKSRLNQGETLDDILNEAFATVREASKRVFGMRHYDVQLIGGMVLHQGRIAEMRTGEGKTLMASLPLYLNALSGKGAHLVTVNDYLAQRDAGIMGKLYGFLGLSTGVIVSGMETQDRRAAYACDITYGTNNEFGFDYLRDNMAFSLQEKVQKALNFAVVDEVDSILIDEARTPLIISGAVEDSSDLYLKLNKIIPRLVKRETAEGEGDYYLDEKVKQAYLTESGHEHMEQLLTEAGLLQAGESLYSSGNIGLMHYLNAVLRAHTLFHKDVDYMIKDNEIMIVDEHTGRAMPGRRWSDGLHQAIEAKEGVKIQAENQTLASITFQNYFKLYSKLAGMTGTADTEAYEFHQIYGLEVVVIPTNKPMVRQDHPDMVYLTTQEKFEAIVKEIKACVEKGQPVLVGTASIETSEYLSNLLNKAGIKHQVLNAKQHAREAAIIAEAGRPGVVTIATNMAGRGTDIILGGNWQLEAESLPEQTDEAINQLKADWQKRHEQVISVGGLHIIGSERHESRRIDNQLRGRSGRQGDPGSSRFYLSLQDNLIRIFASDRIAMLMQKMGMGKGEALESRMISRAIANAQKKVEGHNFDIRKQLLDYDNVANDQRLVIYAQRNELLGADEVSDIIRNIRKDVVAQVVLGYIPSGSLEEQWDIKGLEQALLSEFDARIPVAEWLDKDESLDEEALREKISEQIEQLYEAKKTQANELALKQFEKMILLQSMDTHWREHLSNLDHLRHSINLRGYAQKDPKQEYKREAFNLFSDMLDKFKFDVVTTLSKVKLTNPEQAEQLEDQWRHSVNQMDFQHAELDGMGNEQKENKALSAEFAKVGRNEPCPCGSGKKFKQCHGSLQ
ncbi:MAG: preprotein translocase, SecA subunit [Gammaproteobacteria bacterium]|jgi:preprotein translocase subunit SecA|nr:preprotein translocase, SecA subunit [Gammaproteobacteria bacterium]